MPLSEFLRMARGRLESGQQDSCPADLSSRSEDDLVELVWENGQVAMHGQSNRVMRSSTLNNLPSNTSRVCDGVGLAHATTTRFGKFGVDSTLNDMAPVVPSGDLDLSQDDEMTPWLSYPMDDTLAHDYVSELLPEISGVTGNGMSTGNSFVPVDKKSSCEQTTIGNLRGSLKASSFCASKGRLLCSWPPQHNQMSDALGSGVSDINSNSTSNHPDVVIFGSPAQGRDKDSINVSASIKIERQNKQPPTNNSNFLNFSHFSRPATLLKENVSNSSRNPALVSSGVETMEIKEKISAAASGSNLIKSAVVERFNSITNDVEFRGSSDMLSIVNSSEPVVQATKGRGSRSPEKTENLCQEASVKNDKPFFLCNTDNSTKGVPDGERTIEPMVASSSVGSGNSADRVSCEQTHNSKRKFRYIEESECRSDDVETESLDIKKLTPGRGGTGSKKSRAAEVHNLSERRRRDRINEKMRALQELIPNCNKVDKASMLDEAIEYLKTLQLQVQIMSMGAGLCMPVMMFPPGMQQMHPAHIPHFPPLGVGMGPGMGYGMGGMLDINSGSSGCPIFPVPPMQVPNFHSPVSGITNFQRIPSPNLPVYGHPCQGLAGSVPGAPPIVPLTGWPPATSAMGLSALRNRSNSEVPSTFPTMSARDPMTTLNLQSTGIAEAGSSINEKSDKQQATNKGLDQSAGVQENKQATDTSSNATLTPATSTDISKEPGIISSMS